MLEMTTEFYIVASTKSDVFGYQKVVLSQLGCEAKQVTLEQTKNFNLKFRSNSTFTIPKSDLVEEFKSNHPKKCPIVEYKLSAF